MRGCGNSGTAWSNVGVTYGSYTRSGRSSTWVQAKRPALRRSVDFFGNETGIVCQGLEIAFGRRAVWMGFTLI